MCREDKTVESEDRTGRCKAAKHDQIACTDTAELATPGSDRAVVIFWSFKMVTVKSSDHAANWPRHMADYALDPDQS